MKKFILLLAAVFAVITLQAQEQFGYTALGGADGGTYYIAASATTNGGASSYTFTATKFDSFGLSVSWTPRTSADGKVDIAWETSPDGVLWPAQLTGATNSNQRGYLQLGNNATNAAGQALVFTNFTIPSAGYFRIVAITNTSAVILTNVAVRAYFKPRRQGSYP
jgi:hypothetical protein